MKLGPVMADVEGLELSRADIGRLEHPQVGAVRTVLGSFMHNVEPAAIGCDLAACNDFANGAALAKALAKPALVLAGENDKMCKAEEAEQLAKTLPKGH